LIISNLQYLADFVIKWRPNRYNLEAIFKNLLQCHNTKNEKTGIALVYNNRIFSLKQNLPPMRDPKSLYRQYSRTR